MQVNLTGAGLATIYSDDGITTTPNPVVADVNGRYTFFVANGRYDLLFGGAGLTPYSLTNVEISDAMDTTTLGKTPITFTAANTHSGLETFTGQLIPCQLHTGIFVVGPAACPSLAAANTAAVANGGGEIWVTSPITVSTTTVIGQNSPSKVSVTLRLMRGATVTCSVTGTTDCFQISDSSMVVGNYFGQSSFGAYQVKLANTAVVRDVFRALNQDGTQQSMRIRDVGVDGNAAGGATVQSVFNFTELNEGSDIENSSVIGVQGPNSGSGACALKLATLGSGAGFGFSAINVDHTWFVMAAGNNQALCVDGTAAGSTTSGNRVAFRHGQWTSQGAITGPLITVKSGFAGQFKDFLFENVNIFPFSATSINIVDLNGLFSSRFIGMMFFCQSSCTTSTGIHLGNLANQTNYANAFEGISMVGTGFWTNILVDDRAPTQGGSAQTIAFNSAGSVLDHYSQDDGNTTVARWNEHGIVIPPAAPPGNLAITNFAQTWTAAQTGTNWVCNQCNLQGTGSASQALFITPAAGTNFYDILPTTPAASRHVQLLDAGQTSTWGLNLNATNGFYQSKRGTAGCTTSGGASAFTGACTTTITFPSSFADTNFSVACSGRSAFTGVPLLQGATATAVNQATVQTQQATGVNASFATIDCVAVHD